MPRGADAQSVQVLMYIAQLTRGTIKHDSIWYTDCMQRAALTAAQPESKVARTGYLEWFHGHVCTQDHGLAVEVCKEACMQAGNRNTAVNQGRHEQGQSATTRKGNNLWYRCTKNAGLPADISSNASLDA